MDALVLLHISFNPYLDVSNFFAMFFAIFSPFLLLRATETNCSMHICYHMEAEETHRNDYFLQRNEPGSNLQMYRFRSVNKL